MEGGVVA
jgi:hypothetical protein